MTTLKTGKDDYMLRLAKARDEERAGIERVRKAEQSVIRAARRVNSIERVLDAGGLTHEACRALNSLVRALARLDKLTKRTP